MARTLLIPLGGSGGGGGFDPTQYYTKSQVDTLIQDFITRSVNDLVNYYTKSETYTQSEVNTLIGNIQSIHFEFAASTSDVQDPQGNVIYLIGPSGTGDDKYEEYVYANNQWVKIGDTSVDLSGYPTTTDMQNAINSAMTTLQEYAVENFYQKDEIDTMFAQVQTLQGIQGIKGVDGTNGTNGVDGHQGIQGIKGVDGVNGQQGIQGIKGTDGTNGSQGIQGIAGQNGTNGVDGHQGLQGIMGIQGANGSGGSATRYDISTKSQSELADFYANWETVMATNDVYVGVYPVTAVIPSYTVGSYTALLLEYNTNFALEVDATTSANLVNSSVGAYYILPNGMGDYYGTDVVMSSKNYVDAVANTKQNTLTAGEGISIQGTTISATGGGGGGSAWYGTQAEFEALQNPSADVDYFISDKIEWNEIKGKPDIDSLATKSELNEEVIALDELVGAKENKIQYMSLQGFQSIQPQEGYVYAIEGSTVEMVFTFTDSTQATYNVVID